MVRSTDYPRALFEAVHSLSQLIISQETVDSAVQHIAELATRAIDAAERCTISVPANGTLDTIATSSADAVALDDIQRETQEGPCLSALRQERTFMINDLSNDRTWPRFSPRAAAETTIQSVVAYVLEAQDEVLASLNLMSTRKDAFTQHDVDVGSMFAAHAAVILKNISNHESLKRQVEQLEEGLRTRQMIGQAVGIIMATRHCSADSAFETLKTISQNTNRKLREIAEELVSKANGLDGSSPDS